MELQFPSFSLFLFIATLIIPFILTFCSISFNTHGTHKNLPLQPWKLPLVGHLHHLLGAQPHHALANIAKKLGPIIHLQLGEVSTIVISSPSYAKEIMKTHDLSFANRPKFPSVEILSYNYTDIAFAPYGDYWREMRKICVLELLSSKKVNSFRYIREQESWNLVESIAMHGSKPIDLTEKIFTMMNTIKSRVSVGRIYKDQARFIALIKEGITLINGFDVADLLPSIKIVHVITGINKKLFRVRNEVGEILDSIIHDAL